MINSPKTLCQCNLSQSGTDLKELPIIEECQCELKKEFKITPIINNLCYYEPILEPAHFTSEYINIKTSVIDFSNFIRTIISTKFCDK